MTPRDRVIAALNFKQPDKLPKDLGGMRSTGISAFAYPKLVEAIGLPLRRPKIHDVWQMLALPDLDVLDTLGCDVVAIDGNVTNAFEEPDKWQEYDFAGRLPALVQDKSVFVEDADGTIDCVWEGRKLRMPPSSFVFDEEHGGQPIDFGGEIPKDDLDVVKSQLDEQQPSDEQISEFAAYCKKVRESTERAVFLAKWISNDIGIIWRGGIGIFPVLCITQPDYVAALHELITDFAVRRIRRVLPAIKDYVDIVMMSADDWGTQNSLIASPEVFRNLFLPYMRKVNDECKRIAPAVKIFMHNCGAVYPLIDLIVEAGFDILNPVQWSAGKYSYGQWKEKCDGRIALWGGGVNSQATLPLGTIEEVKKEVKEVVRCLDKGGGYIFNNIHNITAEISPEKIIAMYKAAAEAGRAVS
jgi:uroporphyrinogen decarboxylase